MRSLRLPALRIRPAALALAALLALPQLPAAALDLSEAYRAALEEDATLRAARAAAEARRERVPQARSQLLPNISLSASRFRNHLETTSPGARGQAVTSKRHYNSGSEGLVLRQPIYRKLQLADYGQAKAHVAEAEARLEAQTQELSVRVSSAYFDALLAEEQLQLALSQKVAFATQLEAARRRFAAGAGTRTDVDEALAAVDMATARELEARQAVDFTRGYLRSLINRPAEQLARLDPQKMQLRGPEPAQLEYWFERAEAESPEIQMLQAQLEAARMEVEKARAGHYPTVDAVVQWSRSSSETVTSIDQRNDNKQAGVQLNMPLYAGGLVNSQVRQALALQQQVEEMLEATRRDLRQRVHNEFREVSEGVLRIRALEQAVRSAEQMVVSNRRSFEAGSRTLVDTLNAEQQLAATQRDLSQARFRHLLARVKLLSLAGGPKTQVIDEINAWLQP